ncbi:helix-turn-helix domain-containing protein [Tsuneonella sp. HG222]
MDEGVEALTEKEKETLRLVVRGYDAKAMARHFGLSIHTINERLRHARRKMEVPSSREAARLLFEVEEQHPQFLADKEMGEDAAPRALPPAGDRKARPLRASIIGGLIIMSLLLSTILFLASPPVEAPREAALAPRATTDPAMLAASPQVAAALAFLRLVDAGEWDASYAKTGPAFRTLNSAKVWADTNESVRVPLGKVVSRKVVSEEMVPAPPSSYQMVKFETTFANKADTLETLTLVRDAEGWKVVGYIVD